MIWNYLFKHFFSESINIKLNVYKLKDSSLGLYHTGVEFGDLEYTYCHGIGIAYHKPKKCHFATLLGSKHLGSTEIDKDAFQSILKGWLLKNRILFWKKDSLCNISKLCMDMYS